MSNTKRSSNRVKPTRSLLIKQLPNWFHFRNYRGTAKLDALGWWQQIKIRRICVAYLSAVKKDLDLVSALPDWDQAVKDALAGLRSRPVCDPLSYPFNTKPFSGLEGAHASVPIRSATLQDISEIRSNMLRHLSTEQLREMQEFEGRESLWLRFHRRSGWESIRDDTWPMRAVVIDLSRSDSVLKQQFARYLQMSRTESPGRPERSPHCPDLKFWATHGLLACMDLILWATEEGRRIPDSLLADAVSPDPRGDENLPPVDDDMIRRTIRPLAEKMLRGQIYADSNFQQLQALAAQTGVPGSRF
jgi:hypothetical protein